jgi:toxin YoeB
VEIVYLPQALDDLKFWRNSGNKAAQKRITELLESIEQTPFEGIGKPELLKYDLAGKWSRRITKEHRMIYEMEGNTVFIYSLRGHY